MYSAVVSLFHVLQKFGNWLAFEMKQQIEHVLRLPFDCNKIRLVLCCWDNFAETVHWDYCCWCCNQTNNKWICFTVHFLHSLLYKLSHLILDSLIFLFLICVVLLLLIFVTKSSIISLKSSSWYIEYTVNSKHKFSVTR